MRYWQIAAVVVFFMVSGCADRQDGSASEERSDAPPPPELIRMEAEGISLTEMVSPVFEEAQLELAGTVGSDSEGGSAVAFEFDVSGYELGVQTSDAAVKNCANSGQGQHIHLLIDNGPYSAHYDATFEREVDPGRHVALAFLSRSYHESIKTPAAYTLFEFGGDAGDTTQIFGHDDPHLFYSRPKGVYEGGDTRAVMLDFYLVNADLSENGYKVKALINDVPFLIDKWVPYLMEGLPAGETVIELSLLDAGGEPVNSPFNPVKRTVTLTP